LKYIEIGTPIAAVSMSDIDMAIPYRATSLNESIDVNSLIDDIANKI
jgi:hypothetical protein